MASKFFEENYLVLRQRFTSGVSQSIRQTAGQPADPGAAVPAVSPGLRGVEEMMEEIEQGYRDLLSKANQSFFQREYNIALEKYLALRDKILVESHPEMPAVAGLCRAVSIRTSKINSKPLFELSRRYYERTPPKGPIGLGLGAERVIQPGEFPLNSTLVQFSGLGLDAEIMTDVDLGGLRGAARDRVLNGDLADAQNFYQLAKASAAKRGDIQLTAEIEAESGCMAATYATGPARAAALQAAARSFRTAERLFRQVGASDAQALMKSNLTSLQEEPPAPPPPPPDEDGSAVPRPLSTKAYMVPQNGNVRSCVAVVGSGRILRAKERQVGLLVNGGAKTLSLDKSNFETELRNAVYQPRTIATSLLAIDFNEALESNFVAYIPHLFFFVLPVAIGDTYLAMGLYQQAIDEYQEVLAYPFMNALIERPFLWMRMAKVYQRWGDDLFRQDKPVVAKTKYENIIRTDLAVPLTSPLYQSQGMVPMRATAAEVVKEIKEQAHGAVNPKIGEMIFSAYIQLQKIAQGLNFLGLAADHAPIFRFKYLQSAANYLADNAIQAARAFMNFRSTAETQKLERIQLESTVAVNQAACDVEQKRLEDTGLEVTAAQQTLDWATLRKSHADSSIEEWKTKGKELKSINRALAWMAQHGDDTDVTYTGVKYHGEKHDVSDTASEAVNTLTGWREQINYELQLSRLKNQAEEVAKEVDIASTRHAQAVVRDELQGLNTVLAQKRLEGSQEMLEYSAERMFDEDLWFKLAAEMQDISRYYLDAATYAAFLMERAYAIEFDRDLKRIRLDYGIGGPEGLLGGDCVKRDIASFTLDYMQNAQKKNPMRLAISLRDEFPQAFETFVQTGILPFRTDLEIFDRRYAGTYRRKLKKIELIAEGLVPLEGVHGTLLHQGISTEWASAGSDWVKQTRVMAAERMVLSSYQYRRDYTVFQPSEEMLGLFENLGPQGNWRLEVPRSANNVDYESLSDIKFILYCDADYSDSLAAHVHAFYSVQGGRSLLLSSRFHFPDEYFRLDADRQVTFRLPATRFAYNYANLKLEGFGVRLLAKKASLANQQLSVRRLSDGATVEITTDANGEVQSTETTMAPFADWNGASPIDSFTVHLNNAVDTANVADIQLFIDYSFTYRADGALPA
jgi:Tc toxin complex TcA C-terminal TcB-binding domain